MIARGYAIVFNSASTDLGGFREEIAPSAVDRTLGDAHHDVLALAGHDPARLLGRRSADTLRLAADRHGLAVTIDLPETSDGRDIAALLARGDLTGMSFAFKTFADEWVMRGPELYRTVTDMLIREVSIVSSPAYTATSIALRGAAPVTAPMPGRATGETLDDLRSLAATIRRKLSAARAGTRLSIRWDDDLAGARRIHLIGPPGVHDSAAALAEYRRRTRGRGPAAPATIAEKQAWLREVMAR